MGLCPRSLGLLGASMLLAGGAAAGAAPVQEAESGFIRVVDDQSGLKPRLEAAIRAYEPASGEGPMVYLVTAIHIGDATFYQELQSFLDAQDVVLFEGVGLNEPGTDARWEQPLDDEARAEVSQQRAHWLARRIEEHRQRAGAYPESLLALLEGSPERQRALLEPALLDAWGNAFVYSMVEPQQQDGGPVPYLVSLGADGALEGEGPAADIIVSGRFPPAPRSGDGPGRGLQQDIADALGLEFQLAMMNHKAPNWRNSDMSVEQLVNRLSDIGLGGEGDALLGMLGGESFMSKLSGFFLRIIGANPRMREMVKLMLVDMLSQAEEILAMQLGGMAELMDVLLNDRNDVVVADMKRVLAEEPGVRTLAVIYGGGHLPGVERALLDEMGYQRAGASWVPAITVDLQSAGYSPAEARMMRTMLKQMLERQLRAAQRAGG